MIVRRAQQWCSLHAYIGVVFSITDDRCSCQFGRHNVIAFKHLHYSATKSSNSDFAPATVEIPELETNIG
jgi:hypothetical protein